MRGRGFSFYLFIFLLVLLASYGLFEARKLLEGPEVTISSPANGSATSAELITVEGTAKNIAFLTINDAPAYTDEQGHFVQLLSPTPGVTVITVAAVDRFGRKTQKIISLNVLTYCSLT